MKKDADVDEYVQKLINSKDFIMMVERTIDKAMSTEFYNELNKLRQLNEDTNNLRSEYASLLNEIREVKEDAIKIEYGSRLRYKIAKWFIK